MTIGERIKQRREELEISQTELAHRMGLSAKSTICKLETQGDNITTDRIRRVAKALNCSESYLMGWEENPEDVKARLTEAYIKGNRVARLSKDEKVMKYAEYLMDMSEESRQQAFNYIDLLLLKESQNKG